MMRYVSFRFVNELYSAITKEVPALAASNHSNFFAERETCVVPKKGYYCWC